MQNDDVDKGKTNNRLPQLAVRTGSLLLPLLIPIVFLTIWQIAAVFFDFGGIALPPPSESLASLFQMTADGSIFVDIAASLQRVAGGYVLAGVIGVPLGLAMGYSALTNRLFSGIVNGLRPVPASAWLPLSIILMGIGNRPAIFLVFIGTVWVIIINSSHGVKSVPKHLVWAAQTMGATELTIFTKVIIPASLPVVFAGLRIAVGVAFTDVIVAELLAVRSGLGYLITEGRLMLRTDQVIAGMIAIGIVGFLLDFFVRLIMAYMLRWQEDVTK